MVSKATSKKPSTATAAGKDAGKAPKKPPLVQPDKVSKRKPGGPGKVSGN